MLNIQRELNGEILICKSIDSITKYKNFYSFLFLYIILKYILYKVNTVKDFLLLFNARCIIFLICRDN